MTKPQIEPVPDWMHTPHLICATGAIEFYKTALDEITKPI